MSDVVKQGWILGGFTLVAAVLGAFIGRPIIDEATGEANRVEAMSRRIDSLRAENRLLAQEVSDVQQRIVDRQRLPSGAPAGSEVADPGYGGSSSPAIASRTPANPVPAPDCPLNNTFQCATLLPLGASDSDEFGRERRYYKVQITEPVNVAFTLNPLPNSRDVNTRIYNSEYDQIAHRNFRAGRPESIRVNLRSAGIYYVEMIPAACCSGGSSNYTFTVTQ